MALNYLLDPVFEMVNTAGKPATGGKINVFVHGTRDRYYCASDFNGTLLPFDIPLDSLGSAVILADDSQAYDVYVYNRYGTLMMSRYNVQPKSGGGVSVQSITSTDGTITVTDTAGGVDLSVNGATPSVLRASGNTLTSDGSFTCLPRQKSGNKVIVDQNGKVRIEHGWYHYDIVTHFDYSGTPTNQTVVVALRQGVLESRKEVDLSYPNEGTISLSAEIYNSSLELEEFDISVSGIPDGMSVELVELGIHSIVGHGAGGGGGGATYTAGSGIEIVDDEISIDTDVVATKADLEAKQDTLTAGSNISIVDNVISATAAPQVNADWDATSGVSEILNKPDLSIYAESSDLATVATTGSYDDLLDKPTIPAAQVNADWDATSGIQEILNKPALAAVATSGAYADLSGTPTLATVATSGSYDDLLDKPSIPPAQVNADWTSPSGVSKILHKPAEKDLVAGSNITITESNGTVTISAAASGQVNSDWDATSGVAEILHKPDLSIYAESSDLATVATSGSYNDLLDKPSIPSAQVNADWNSTSGVSAILNKPNLATVATTGDYSDLQNLPSIPAAQINSDWDATSGVAQILNKPTIPSYTAGNGIDITSGVVSAKVDGTTIDTNASGELTVIGGGGGGGSQVNSDWDATSGVAEILNKPTPKTLTAGANISISEGVGTLTISAAAGLPASTSADEGKCLVVDSNGDPEWGTGGKTYTGTDGVVVDNVNDTVGLEAPVDLVAGPGITVDNPDGNTVRVSANMDSTYLNQLAVALGIDRTELWSGELSPATGSNCNVVITLSESILNFERIEVFCTGIVSYLTWSPRDRSGNAAYRGINENQSNDVVIGAMMIQEDDRTKLRYRCGYGSSFTTAYRGEYWGYGTPYKVVGVHRIAGGN